MMADLERCEVSKAQRDALSAFLGGYGVTVSEDWNEPEGARFIGTFSGRHITLFPRNDSHFAMYFTVAHLYGHMTQMTRRTDAMDRSNALVYGPHHPMSPEDVQCVYDYEIEAAAIGRKAMEVHGGVSEALHRQYSRMFFADFHYLMNYIETGELGMEVFERFLRREPVPWTLIEPDARPLIDLAVNPPFEYAVTVV